MLGFFSDIKERAVEAFDDLKAEFFPSSSPEEEPESSEDPHHRQAEGDCPSCPAEPKVVSNLGSTLTTETDDALALDESGSISPDEVTHETVTLVEEVNRSLARLEGEIDASRLGSFNKAMLAERLELHGYLAMPEDPHSVNWNERRSTELQEALVEFAIHHTALEFEEVVEWLCQTPRIAALRADGELDEGIELQLRGREALEAKPQYGFLHPLDSWSPFQNLHHPATEPFLEEKLATIREESATNRLVITGDGCLAQFVAALEAAEASRELGEDIEVVVVRAGESPPGLSYQDTLLGSTQAESFLTYYDIAKKEFSNGYVSRAERMIFEGLREPGEVTINPQDLSDRLASLLAERDIRVISYAQKLDDVTKGETQQAVLLRDEHGNDIKIEGDAFLHVERHAEFVDDLGFVNSRRAPKMDLALGASPQFLINGISHRDLDTLQENITGKPSDTAASTILVREVGDAFVADLRASDYEFYRKHFLNERYTIDIQGMNIAPLENGITFNGIVLNSDDPEVRAEWRETMTDEMVEVTVKFTEWLEGKLEKNFDLDLAPRSYYRGGDDLLIDTKGSVKLNDLYEAPEDTIVTLEYQNDFRGVPEERLAGEGIDPEAVVSFPIRPSIGAVSHRTNARVVSPYMHDPRTYGIARIETILNAQAVAAVNGVLLTLPSEREFLRADLLQAYLHRRSFENHSLWELDPERPMPPPRAPSKL